MCKGFACNNPIIEEFNKKTPDYGYQPVRIKPYWTRGLINHPKNKAGELLNRTWAQMTTANKILRDHTLALSIHPFGNYISQIDYDHEFSADRNRDPELIKKVYDMMANPRESQFARETGMNRRDNWLYVLFCQIPESDYAHGAIALLNDHSVLPFVIVDPLRATDNTVLIHEIGHASRCSHVAGSIMEAYSAGSGQTNFHNIHTWEIYRSYWCTGPRPQNFWVYTSISGTTVITPNSPYQWGPFDRPTPP